MRARPLLTAATLLGASLAAHADTISSFTITGGSVFYGLAGDTNTISGAASIDVTSGMVQSISFTAGGITESGVDSQYGPVVFVGADAAKFTFTGTTLVLFDGGTFNLNGPNDLYVGQVRFAPVPDPTTAVTPEPSSIALLGTGMLGVAGVVRRRLLRV